VFDAGADDGTREVCQWFRDKYPDRIRYFAQAKQGKSNALNVGIAAARGEILALTDDDVICDTHYVANIVNFFDDYPVDAAQGRILLDCEKNLPAWVSARHLEFMSLRDFGNELQLSFHGHLTGTNMVVRTAATRAIGGFAPELGAGTTVGFSEDTEFSRRLRHAGYKIVYAPQILVRHHLPHRRLTKRFFRERYFLLGRSRAYYSPYVAPLWRFGVYTVKNWIFADAAALQLRAKGRAPQALDRQCEARFQAGLFWQHCLFSLGLPRRLTRITNWPEQADDLSVNIEPSPTLAACPPGRVG
jgi:GT2 family glycosyltransferase